MSVLLLKEMLTDYVKSSYTVLNFISRFVTHLDPACPFVSKSILCIYTTYLSGMLGPGGGTHPKIKYKTVNKSLIKSVNISF